MIDIWLIFCLLIPLVEVMFHAMLDKYRYDIEVEDAGVGLLSNVGPDMQAAPKKRVERKKKTLNRLQNLGMIGFPLMFIIFVAVYFFVGLC